MGMLKKAARKKKSRDISQDIRNESHGFMACMFMAYLRVKKGYGEQRLRETFRDFLEFFNDMTFEGATTADFVNMIKDECGVDLEAEFSQQNIKLTLETAERKRAIKEGDYAEDS